MHPRSIARHLAVAVLALASCASTPELPTAAGPDAVVPRFPAGDPRVETGGFVRQTLRITEEVEGTKYTLMAFVVGETATLGAMVEEAFAGDVHWTVGEHSLRFPMDTSVSLSGIEVVAEGPRLAPELSGDGASFRGISWINVEVPADELVVGAPLQLEFVPASGGASIVLPEAGYHYVTRIEDR